MREDTPSVLHLVFTRHESEIEEINYDTPLGKSDHLLLDFMFIIQYDTTEKKSDVIQDYNYKKGRYQELFVVSTGKKKNYKRRT